MVGGVSFFARREVKDLLGYLRLAANPADRVAFWRVWNTPRRGLGDAVRARVEARADLPPLEALRAIVAEGLRGAARSGAESFLGLLDELRARIEEPPAELLRLVLERTEYLRMLDDDGEGKAADRRANVEELLVAAAEYAPPALDDGPAPGALAGFLAEATLTTDADRVEEGVDRVLMLTAHTAKGLEFPLVIVAGLEEGLLPHASSLDEPKGLEEERRLFYVAITRARDEVMLTAAAYRRRFTADGVFAARGGAVSRFVEEIPPELIDREETSTLAAKSAIADGSGTGWLRQARFAPSRESAPAYRTRGPLAKTIGKEVYHETFGRGVVVMAEGAGPDARFTVRFGTQIKKVMGRFLTGGIDVD
jgi:DNA helicase-2/ATP-dependent DNA helicase PcrA